MENENNKKRTANYTKEECWRLVEIIERLAHIIENKKTDALTWKEKKAAWQKVGVMFNSVGTQNRTWEQLRSKYETLKKEARRAVAKSRTAILGTGGGPCEANINPLYEKIRAVIKLSADGTPSCFDSDYIDAERTDRIDPGTGTPILIDHVETKGDNTVTCISTPMLIDTGDVTNDDCMFDEDNSHAGSDMKKLKVPELQQPYKRAQWTSYDFKSTVPAVAGGTSKDESTAPSDALTSNDVNGTEVNNWNSYCPAQLQTPKHPALQTPRKGVGCKRKISAAGKKMQPWIDAKTELTSKKIELLQEEFDTKHLRERELHEQQLQLNNQQIKINELIIEKMKLEIEIMRK